MTGGPTCWKPRGTFCKILMGYLPDALLRCLQYSQDAIVKMTITNAFLNTDMKKKRRSAMEQSVRVTKKHGYTRTPSGEPCGQDVASYANQV